MSSYPCAFQSFNNNKSTGRTKFFGVPTIFFFPSLSSFACLLFESNSITFNKNNLTHMCNLYLGELNVNYENNFIKRQKQATSTRSCIVNSNTFYVKLL